MKVMNGFYSPDRGVIQFNERPVAIRLAPRRAPYRHRDRLSGSGADPGAQHVAELFSRAGTQARTVGRSGASPKREMRRHHDGKLREMGLTRLRSPDEPVDILSGGRAPGACHCAGPLFRRQPAAARRADIGAVGQGDRESVGSGAHRARAAASASSSSTTTSGTCIGSATASSSWRPAVCSVRCSATTLPPSMWPTWSLAGTHSDEPRKRSPSTSKHGRAGHDRRDPLTSVCSRRWSCGR